MRAFFCSSSAQGMERSLTGDGDKGLRPGVRVSHPSVGRASTPVRRNIKGARVSPVITAMFIMVLCSVWCPTG